MFEVFRKQIFEILNYKKNL